MIKCSNVDEHTGLHWCWGIIGAWPVIALYNHEYGFLKSQTQLQARMIVLLDHKTIFVMPKGIYDTIGWQVQHGTQIPAGRD